MHTALIPLGLFLKLDSRCPLLISQMEIEPFNAPVIVCCPSCVTMTSVIPSLDICPMNNLSSSLSACAGDALFSYPSRLNISSPVSISHFFSLSLETDRKDRPSDVSASASML